MKKLKIKFTDGSSIIYTIKDSVPWQPYYKRHSESDIQSAVMQQYPLKNNEPVVLVAK